MVLKYKLLGWYQIVGGLWGLFILFREAFYLNLNDYQIVIALFFITLYVAVALSGYLILKQRKYAFNLALFVILLQIVQIYFNSFGYAFVAGTFMGLDVGDNISFFFKPLYANFQISLSEQSMNYVSINFMPVLILIYFRESFF